MKMGVQVPFAASKLPAGLPSAAVCTPPTTEDMQHAPSSSGQSTCSLRLAPSTARDSWQASKVLLAGGISGAVSKTFTAPLARVTILYQVGAMRGANGGTVGLSTAMQRIVGQEGLMALWRGNSATILHRIPYTASNFFVYEQANQLLKAVLPASSNGTSVTDSLRRLVAGGIAGGIACTAAYPLDLVRTRMAAQTNAEHASTVVGVLRDTVRKEGLCGLYKGLSPTLLQSGPSLAINYCVYESLRSQWLAGHPGEKVPPIHALLGCASLSGIASSTLTFPLDVIRRRMQLQGYSARPGQHYSGFMNAFVTIARHEGMRGFYTGLIPEYAKVVPGVAITYCTYEAMKSLLLGNDFNSTR